MQSLLVPSSLSQRALAICTGRRSHFYSAAPPSNQHQSRLSYYAAPPPAVGSSTRMECILQASPSPPSPTAAAELIEQQQQQPPQPRDPLVQYVVLRRDLWTEKRWPLGSVVAQACHASSAAMWIFKEDPHTLEYLAVGRVIFVIAWDDGLCPGLM